MHTTRLRRVGGSVMLAVPPALLHLLRLGPGVKVGIAVEDGRRVVEPERRPRYGLDELLVQRDPRAPRSRRDRRWAAAKAAGAELI